MQFLVSLVLISPVSSLKVQNDQIPLRMGGDGGPATLREWMQEDKCLNIALAPQFNNQHSLFGIMQYFKDEGLLSKVTGIAACSGGTLPAAFFGAGLDFKKFNETFPDQGWQAIGPSEPKITEDFHNFVKKSGLPEKMEDFKTPVAVSLSMWETEKAMTETNPNVTALVVNKGSTQDTLTAALATGSEGGIPDPACPRCLTGFWPKRLGNASTVTDGAFSDLMGVQGLIGLPQCDRVLHVLPLDYPGQIGAMPRAQIPGNPKDIVTLFFTQPPVASHGYFMEGVCNKTIPFTDIPFWCNSFWNTITGGLIVKSRPTLRSGGEWNQKMFDVVHEATGYTIDQPFDGESEPGHKIITLQTHKLFKAIETKNENDYNLMAQSKRDAYWSNFLSNLEKDTDENLIQKDKSDTVATSKATSALSSVKKDMQATYEMPHIKMKTTLNYPAA